MWGWEGEAEGAEGDTGGEGWRGRWTRKRGEMRSGVGFGERESEGWRERARIIPGFLLRAVKRIINT